MGSVEGIIFSDLFISNKEMFTNIFSQVYQERQAEMDIAITELELVLTKYETQTITATMANEFKVAWKNFQNIVLFNNNDLQLLVAYRGQSGRDAEFSQIIKQEDVEGVGQTQYGKQYGIKAGDSIISDSMAAIKASKVESYLRSHLNGFLNQLEDSIDKSDAEKIHDFHEYCLVEYLQNSDEHVTGLRWREAFYGSNASRYFGGQGLGQAYDAFMNHIADKNPVVYDYLASGGITGSNFAEINNKDGQDTVYSEEGGVEPSGHYAELLRDSKNHVGWYTGGDIVIVNAETMQVVYNIQLKTTTRNKASIFSERISKIRTFITGFQKLSPQQKAEKIFDFFLTSVSNRSDFNNKPQEEIDSLIEKSLSQKLNIQINLTR